MRFTIIISLFLVTTLSAQNIREQESARRLDKIILIEEQEHDLRGAEAGYKSLTKTATGITRAKAWLRLGKLYRHVGRQTDALAAFQRAAENDGTTGAEARRELARNPQDPERIEKLRARAREILDHPGNINLWTELRWLGEPIVPLLLERTKKEPKWYPYALSIGGEVMLRHLETIYEQEQTEKAYTLVKKSSLPSGVTMSEPIRRAFEQLFWLEDPTDKLQAAAIYYYWQSIRSRRLMLTLVEHRAPGFQRLLALVKWHSLDDSVPRETANQRFQKTLLELCDSPSSSDAKLAFETLA